MKAMENKKAISLRMPSDLYHQAQQAAKGHGVSFNALALIAIEAYIQGQGAKPVQFVSKSFKRTGIRLSGQMNTKLDVYAKEQGLTKNAVVVLALESYLGEIKRRQKN